MAKSTKTKVTLIQNVMGQPVRVRIGEAEIPVANAGVVLGIGVQNLVMTIANVEVDLEADQPVDAKTTP